eukprot:Gregarina_sp_Pseudo_9__2610@NODE_2870_length_843_cov_11_034826_g782_i3_p1_GENE_NODE_2870_length_843_cov_11_034826_g782_i3NODE_2870_length_843_cov_11_034826_g782_i3_p1_ORF_typecomplete_len161_score26_16_NODE_2870_length_843_cov_11_034826_g782_i3359790
MGHPTLQRLAIDKVDLGGSELCLLQLLQYTLFYARGQLVSNKRNVRWMSLRQVLAHSEEFQITSCSKQAQWNRKILTVSQNVQVCLQQIPIESKKDGIECKETKSFKSQRSKLNKLKESWRTQRLRFKSQRSKLNKPEKSAKR